MKIEKYGVGERCLKVMQKLLHLESEEKLPQGISRIILLPIPTARDSIHVTGTEKILAEVLSNTKRGDYVCGYAIPKELTERIRASGAAVFDAKECEDFQRENAYISALGAIGYILTEMKAVPSDLSFGVVGYGRIGKELVRLLLFLGAKVRIYTSKELTRLELGECGVETVYTDYSEKSDIKGIDVLINTAPTSLVCFFDDGRIPDGLRVIELASGENFGGIAGVERLMAIPDKMYSSSAAEAYFRAIEKNINEVFVE